MCEFMFRMFYAYKNGEFAVYHNDGNQHKRVLKNAAVILAEVSVRRFNHNYQLFANL